MIEIFLVSILLGIVTGLLAGLFGIGGGLVIVPVLVMLFTAQGFPTELVMLMAVATSLAAIILTAIASVSAHHRLGAVVWAKVFSLSPGIMIGAALGAVVAKQINGDTLRYILVIFLLYVGLQMAFQVKPKPGMVKQSRALDFLVANFIGLLSSIVGIGGGTLTVPYLVSGQMLMRNAVAVASACGLPIAVAGTVSYALLGWNATHPLQQALHASSGGRSSRRRAISPVARTNASVMPGSDAAWPASRITCSSLLGHA